MIERVEGWCARSSGRAVSSTALAASGGHTIPDHDNDFNFIYIHLQSIFSTCL